MRQHKETTTDILKVKQFLLALLVLGGLPACVPVGLVSVPLHLAMDQIADVSEEQPAQTAALTSAGGSGPISVDTLLARARGEDLPADPSADLGESMSPTGDVATRPQVSIRLSYASGERAARDAAIVWLRASKVQPDQTIWVVAAADGAPDDPTAVFNGISKANGMKAWLSAVGKTTVVTFDPRAEPGTITLSLEQPGWLTADKSDGNA